LGALSEGMNDQIDFNASERMVLEGLNRSRWRELSISSHPYPLCHFDRKAGWAMFARHLCLQFYMCCRAVYANRRCRTLCTRGWNPTSWRTKRKTGFACTPIFTSL
jgi:hypothetical protein